MASSSSHQIRQVHVRIVEIPAKAVHSHGSGDVGAIKSVILELVTESGLSGFGEASPWPVFTGTAEANAAAIEVYAKPLLLGADPLLRGPLLHQIDGVIVGHTEAKAAIEAALLDLGGKILGLPVAELLGGRHRSAMPLSFSVANPDFDQDLADIAELWADGVRLFKLKTGFNDHQFDLMRLEKLRGLYGQEIDLRIDYNQGLKAFDAVRHINDLAAFRPTFVEQPVKMHERAALAAITHAVDVPIMADESVFGVKEALAAAETRMADVISLKIMKSGGLKQCLTMASIARAAGLDVYGGCMFETGIAHLAGTHMLAAVPDLHLGCEFYMSTYYATDDVLAAPFPVKAGLVEVPDAPGLGAEIDRGKLEFYTKN